MLRYAITEGRAGVSRPEKTAVEGRRELLRRCAVLAEEGVDYLLIREYELEAGALLRLTQEVVEACQGSGTRVLVARRADVALAGGAAGVHLTGSAGELSAAQVRRVFARAVVSKSCHTVDEVSVTAGAGVDLILFGPVFGKSVAGVEVVAATGIEVLRQACAAAGSTPVLALGGVTRGNSAECVRVGAAGVAGMRLYFAE